MPLAGLISTYSNFAYKLKRLDHKENKIGPNNDLDIQNKEGNHLTREGLYKILLDEDSTGNKADIEKQQEKMEIVNNVFTMMSLGDIKAGFDVTDITNWGRQVMEDDTYAIYLLESFFKIISERFIEFSSDVNRIQAQFMQNKIPFDIIEKTERKEISFEDLDEMVKLKEDRVEGIQDIESAISSFLKDLRLITLKNGIKVKQWELPISKQIDRNPLHDELDKVKTKLIALSKKISPILEARVDQNEFEGFKQEASQLAHQIKNLINFTLSFPRQRKELDLLSSYLYLQSTDHLALEKIRKDLPFNSPVILTIDQLQRSYKSINSSIEELYLKDMTILGFIAYKDPKTSSEHESNSREIVELQKSLKNEIQEKFKLKARLVELEREINKARFENRKLKDLNRGLHSLTEMEDFIEKEKEHMARALHTVNHLYREQRRELEGLMYHIRSKYKPEELPNIDTSSTELPSWMEIYARKLQKPSALPSLK